MVTGYSQGQTAEDMLHMLAVIGEGCGGLGEAAQCGPEDLELREGDLPVAGVLLNQLKTNQS